MAMMEPILMDCEGEGCTGNRPGRIGALCQMCGKWYPLDDNGLIPKHKRQDVIAMLQRGDFG